MAVEKLLSSSFKDDRKRRRKRREGRGGRRLGTETGREGRVEEALRNVEEKSRRRNREEMERKERTK